MACASFTMGANAYGPSYTGTGAANGAASARPLLIAAALAALLWFASKRRG